MGTRCLTFVYAQNDEKIINLYRQFDGYPSGHGKELYDFLKNIVLVNGISSSETRKVANGIECLAAQMVAHFKEEVGGFYLHSVNDDDCGQDYE